MMKPKTLKGMMERTELITLIEKELPEEVLKASEMPNDDVMIEVARSSVVSVMETLKNSPRLRFDTLMNHLGVDYGDRFAVIYNLYSYLLDRKVTVKVYLDHEKPEVATLEPVFRGISWYERETWDLLGIKFLGHSNLRRLLLPPDWEGHPLRKDYEYPQSIAGIDNSKRGLPDG